LVLEVKLPDGEIEKVTPPPGFGRLYPDKAPKEYQAAIEDLENLMKNYPDLKLSLCHLYLEAGRNQDAKACYDDLADIFHDVNDIAAQALVMNQAALLAWELDPKEAAIRQARDSFEIYRQQVKKLREAEKRYQITLQSAQDADDRESQLLTRQQLALVLYALGQYKESKQHAEAVLKLFGKIEYPLLGKQRMEKLIVDQMRQLLQELDLMEKDME
ncbi:MAG: tetratricopeptide repeat protein, partial [bacterium]|nr:tetratricopeptide repeat protein [bacterium]